MSAFKQSMRKLGTRAGLLVGASAAILAIAGTGSAAAVTPSSPACPGGAVAGRGSSLQKIAQEVWTAKYNTACPGSTATYESTSSGSGLEAFRFNGAGTINHSFTFIGTDDGPNTTQIANAEAASGTPAIIVPVSQTAIALVVHPPSGCTITGGISWLDLNKIWGGSTITNWNQISTASGTCNQAITRVVRAEGSGTTFQFKNYLGVLQETKSAEAVPCSTEGTTKWKELTAVGTGNKPNITWPKCSESSSPIVTAAGGGALAETVAKVANVGYIGYASLPDAKAKGATVANLQNGTLLGAKTYAEPGDSSNSTARCGNARYTVATGSETIGTSRDWSAVFGASPSIGGSEYPLCTLTYDTGWDNYVTAGYTAAQGNTARDYLSNYVIMNGQSDLETAAKWYSKLPTGGGPGSGTDVANSAQTAAELIG